MFSIREAIKRAVQRGKTLLHFSRHSFLFVLDTVACLEGCDLRVTRWVAFQITKFRFCVLASNWVFRIIASFNVVALTKLEDQILNKVD